MKKTIATLVVLGATLSAQQVAPKAYTSKEGERYAYYVGSYANGHYQFAEGGLRGTAIAIKRFGYRRDSQYNVTPSYCSGRSWTNVKVHLSDCQIGKLTNVWTTNSLTVPKKLFDNKYSWPSYNTAPKTTPAAFDPQLSFPLTSTYLYAGKQDLLIDFQFAGGTLANNVTWGTGFRSYYKDAPDVLNLPPFYQGTNTFYGNRGCADSAQSFGGLMTSDFKSYAKSVGNPQQDDKFFFEIGSYFTAPNAAVIQGLGLAVNAPGLKMGTCNNLHLSSLLAIFAGTSSGPTALKLTTFGYIPYDPKAVGVNLYAQAAWNDSKTKALKLTQAVGVQIPAQPPAQVPRMLLYSNSLTQTTGFGPYNSYYRNPVVQYSSQ